MSKTKKTNTTKNSASKGVMQELESLCEEIRDGYLLATYDGYDSYSTVEIERMILFADLGDKQLAYVRVVVRETPESKRAESYELVCLGGHPKPAINGQLKTGHFE